MSNPVLSSDDFESVDLESVDFLVSVIVLMDVKIKSFGHPQFGHASACVDTSFPHSGQLTNAI